MPLWTLLALLTLPLAIKAIRGAFSYNEPAKLVAGMGANVHERAPERSFSSAIGYIIDYAV